MLAIASAAAPVTEALILVGALGCWVRWDGGLDGSRTVGSRNGRHCWKAAEGGGGDGETRGGGEKKKGF